MGVGATRVFERVAACMGLLPMGAETHFEASYDVAHGGVLCAVPSLIACGLLHKTEKHFPQMKGYYRLEHIFLVLSLMALCRLKSVENLRYVSPGEWGKLLGLDRIPEVRTLRKKIHGLVETGHPKEWSSELSQMWMAAAPEDAMVLYVDGHVRVYHGSNAKLPKHYVARQRLCLYATTDYWVNAMDGKPFFVVNTAVDPGLIQVLEHTILPRLKKEIPNQPTEKELEADPLLHRFTLVFDREGWSPDLFARLKADRIACLTYKKHTKDLWSEDTFQKKEVTLVSGETVEMSLAECKTRLSNGLEVREVRRLTQSGHQTSIISTNDTADFCWLAVHMFARWSQENFLRYMREHFGLDALCTYSTDPISDTQQVVNPAYRALDGAVRKKVSLLNRARAEFGALSYQEVLAPSSMERFQQKKATLKERIDALESEVQTLKANRKAMPRHILIKELPEEDHIKPLAYTSKHFMDTIKMVAYRAETVMANVLKKSMTRPDETRSVLRSLYETSADIIPDDAQGTLTIHLHQTANHSNDEGIHSLLDLLNETQTIFPGSNLRMVFKWGSAVFR